jgi:hypothetical protein
MLRSHLDRHFDGYELKLAEKLAFNDHDADYNIDVLLNFPGDLCAPLDLSDSFVR